MLMREMLRFLTLEIQNQYKKIKVTYRGKQKGDVYKTKAKNINKSRLIGFKYKVDLENGLNKFYEWFKNEK